MDDKPKKPWIGFLGMLLIAMAFCAMFVQMNAVAFVFLVAGAVALGWQNEKNYSNYERNCV